MTPDNPLYAGRYMAPPDSQERIKQMIGSLMAQTQPLQTMSPHRQPQSQQPQPMVAHQPTPLQNVKRASTRQRSEQKNETSRQGADLYSRAKQREAEVRPEGEQTIQDARRLQGMIQQQMEGASPIVAERLKDALHRASIVADQRYDFTQGRFVPDLSNQQSIDRNAWAAVYDLTPGHQLITNAVFGAALPDESGRYVPAGGRPFVPSDATGTGGRSNQNALAYIEPAGPNRNANDLYAQAMALYEDRPGATTRLAQPLGDLGVYVEPGRAMDPYTHLFPKTAGDALRFFGEGQVLGKVFHPLGHTASHTAEGLAARVAPRAGRMLGVGEEVAANAGRNVAKNAVNAGVKAAEVKAHGAIAHNAVTAPQVNADEAAREALRRVFGPATGGGVASPVMEDPNRNWNLDRR